ncbi:MAG TPA: hypothetical protein VGB25_11285 [Candidatus Binatia bacterium]
MAQKKLKPITIGYRHNLEVLTFILRDSGLLQKYGLDPTVRHVPDSTQGNQMLYRGEVDFFLGNHISPYVERKHTGAHFVYLAQPSNLWPSKLIVKPWINSLQDLKGKGMTFKGERGSHGDLANRGKLKAAGIDFKRDNIQEIRDYDKDINYVERYRKFRENDDAAATLLSPPYDVIARRDGLKVLEIPEYPQIHNVTINSIAETIKTKPGETIAFLKAYCEAICLFKTQKERTKELLWEALSAKLHFDDEAIERLYDDVNSTMQKKPYPSTDAIYNTFELALGDYPELEDMNPVSMWDLHFLRELDDEGFIDELYKNAPQ